MQPLVYVPRCGKKGIKLFLLLCDFRPNTKNLCCNVSKRILKPFLVCFLFFFFNLGCFRCCAVLILRYDTHVCLEVYWCSFCTGEFFMCEPKSNVNICF